MYVCISRGGHGNLLQYSCLENPMDRGAWRAKSTASQSVYMCAYAYILMCVYTDVYIYTEMRYYPFGDSTAILTHLLHIEILVRDRIAILKPIYTKRIASIS